MFYGLPVNSGTVTLARAEWTVPDSYEFGEDRVVPMWAGATLRWQVVERTP
jgi:dihydroorotase